MRCNEVRSLMDRSPWWWDSDIMPSVTSITHPICTAAVCSVMGGLGTDVNTPDVLCGCDRHADLTNTLCHLHPKSVWRPPSACVPPPPPREELKLTSRTSHNLDEVMTLPVLITLLLPVRHNMDLINSVWQLEDWLPAVLELEKLRRVYPLFKYLCVLSTRIQTLPRRTWNPGKNLYWIQSCQTLWCWFQIKPSLSDCLLFWSRLVTSRVCLSGCVCPEVSLILFLAPSVSLLIDRELFSVDGSGQKLWVVPAK